MSTPKRKHQGISIAPKKKIIDASSAKSYGQLATDFGLSRSTISTICGRDKQKILDAIDEEELMKDQMAKMKQPTLHDFFAPK